ERSARPNAPCTTTTRVIVAATSAARATTPTVTNTAIRRPRPGRADGRYGTGGGRGGGGPGGGAGGGRAAARRGAAGRARGGAGGGVHGALRHDQLRLFDRGRADAQAPVQQGGRERDPAGAADQEHSGDPGRRQAGRLDRGQGGGQGAPQDRGGQLFELVAAQ